MIPHAHGNVRSPRRGWWIVGLALLAVGGAIASSGLLHGSTPSIGVEPMEPAKAPATLDRSAIDSQDPAVAAETARGLKSSFVRVAFALRYDDGEAPSTLAWSADALETLAKSERPLELAGFLLAADRVLILDPQIHPRFVSRITVSQGPQRATARVVGMAAGVPALLLALDQTLASARALSFDDKGAPPYRQVTYSPGTWTTVIAPAFNSIHVSEDGSASARTTAPALIVDGRGTPVGMTTDGWLRVDGSWKGSPLSWKFLDATARNEIVSRTESIASGGLLRVRTRFRSPKADDAKTGRYRYRRSDDEPTNETERSAVGVLVGPRKVLVLDKLDATTTARLESIAVFMPDGQAVAAQFVSTYRDFGAFLVSVSSDLSLSLPLSRTELRRYESDFLLATSMEIKGEKRVMYCNPFRVTGYEEGWRGQRSPSIRGSAEHQFLFDRTGNLVAIPILLRTPALEEDDWRSEDAVLLSAGDLAPLLDSPADHSDPAIVPAPAEKDGCLAWLGVETQPLDSDLARANQVSHLTRNGQTGVLVSFVYPGSPAQQIGLDPGMVLLRLVVPSRLAPLDITGTEVPHSYLDDFDDEDSIQSPGFTPWPSVENGLNKMLMGVGVGNEFTLEYAVGGKPTRADLRVAEGPLHFEVAPFCKADELGATFRNLTYEVRRHFHLESTAPGVIVSKVERGSRAAVAGLRRFDIVTEVNGLKVVDCATMGKALSVPGDLRITVKGMLEQRVVKIAAQAR